MSLRIGTLNIWNLLGPWEERLPSIRNGVRAENVDVLFLQEVVKTEGLDQAELIAEGHEYNVVYGRHTGARLPIGNAILSRFPVLHHEVFDLPTGDTIERRTLVYALLNAPFGQLPFFGRANSKAVHQ